MIDFTEYLSRGDGVWWGQAAAEPRPLVDALIAQSARIGPIRTFTGIPSCRDLLIMRGT